MSEHKCKLSIRSEKNVARISMNVAEQTGLLEGRWWRWAGGGGGWG